MRKFGRAKLIPLSDIVARYLSERHGPEREREAMALRVFEAFRKIGPPLTDHAEPLMLRGGILTLQVAESAWLTELTFLRDEILERVNQGLPRPAVRALRMRLGPVSVRPPPKRTEPKPSPELMARIDSWSAAIGDEEIREAMKRAAKWSLTRPPPLIPLVFDGPPGPQPRREPPPPRDPEPSAPKDRWDPDRDRWKRK